MQQKISATTEADIAVDLDKCSPYMDLQPLFARPAPLHIEVGSGKGTFLVNQGRANPNVNYLGIEWANKYYRYSVDRVRRWSLPNIRFLRADAREFIGRYLPDAAVATFHVYFPDPWPKKRHHKRRFFIPENLQQVLRTLTAGGELRTATDHAEYFQTVKELLTEHETIARQFEQIEFLPTDTADEGEWVGSNFERKYIKEGRQFYTLAVRKKA